MESQTEVSSQQSLWKHKQRCQGNPHVGENMMQEDGCQDANQIRSTTSTFAAYNKSSKNPKIRALLNEIINDTTSTNPNEEKASWKQSTTVLPSPPQEVVTDLFKEKLPTTNYQLPSPHVVDEVFPQAVKTKPRTKGVIIGFSDGESDDDDEQCIRRRNGG